MANQINESYPCLLISIQSQSKQDGLFHSYRDYLVFMSLIRDGVRSGVIQIYGFCWIENHCLMIIHPQNNQLGSYLLKLLKRYHYWLLQRGPRVSEFKLRILEFSQSSWVLDCLRFIHQFAVNESIVDDAMDYHWHSYHIYNGFWTFNWLNTDYILNKFASNHLVAMNRFRQYMLHGYRLNYLNMLQLDDVSKNYLSEQTMGEVVAHQKVVAEINSHYHQSLLKRTRIKIEGASGFMRIKVSVTEKEVQLESIKSALS